MCCQCVKISTCLCLKTRFIYASQLSFLEILAIPFFKTRLCRGFRGKDVLSTEKLESHSGAQKAFEKEDILSDINDLLPDFKYLSYGLFRAWLLVTYNTTIFSLFGESPIDPAGMQIVFTPAIALVGLALALLQDRPAHNRVLSSSVGWLLALISTFGIALALLSSLWGGLPLFVCGMVCAGIGVGWMTVRCGLMFSRMSTRSIFVHAAGGEAFAFLLYFLIIGMSPVLRVVAFVFLPFAVMFCLSLEDYGSHDDAGENPYSATSGAAFPWSSCIRFLIVLALLSLAGALSREFLISSRPLDLSSISSIRMGCAFFIALGVMCIALFTRKRVSFLPLYYLLVLAVIVILMCMPFFNETLSLGSVCLSILFLPFKLLAWCLFCGFARYWSSYSTRIVGLSSFFMEGGTVLGWAVSVCMVCLQPDTTTQLIVSLVFILLLVIVAFIMFRESDMHRLDGRDSEEYAPSGAAVSHEENDSSITTLDFVASQYHLSRREREVFELLVHGRDYAYIAEKLYIARNTVKTHIKNIYSKLGVRSKQELLDLVDDISSTDANSRR